MKTNLFLSYCGDILRLFKRKGLFAGEDKR